MVHFSDEQKIILDQLVEELTKDKPNAQMVKQAMEQLNMKYSDDPIERLNIVLMGLHPQIQDKELKDIGT